jgi:uncharacterized protein (DUF4415 family)
MRKEYDFARTRRNPYVARVTRQITIRLDPDAIAYFAGIARETGIPYRNLINLYLRDCAASQRRLDFPGK